VSVTPTPVTLFSHVYPPAPALGSTSAACTYSKYSSDEADRYIGETTATESSVGEPVTESVTAPTPVTLYRNTMHEVGDSYGSATSNTYIASCRSPEEVEPVVDRAVDEVVLQGPDWVVTEADHADYRSAFVDISSDEELEEGEVRD